MYASTFLTNCYCFTFSTLMPAFMILGNGFSRIVCASVNLYSPGVLNVKYSSGPFVISFLTSQISSMPVPSHPLTSLPKLNSYCALRMESVGVWKADIQPDIIISISICMAQHYIHMIFGCRIGNRKLI